MATVDSSMVRRFMDQTSLDEESEQAFQEIHASIGQDSNILMGLIMSLERHLTSSEDKERNRATLLLAKLLESQNKALTASQIHHFCVFFNSRVADYPSLSPCLRALKGIIEHQWENFDEKYQDVSDIFNTVFKELEVQDLPQSIRSRVFSLLLALLSCPMAVAVVQSQGHRVVQGVLNAVEGEKDPRCLVQCFRLVALLLRAFPPALLLELSAPRPAASSAAGGEGGKNHDHHDDHDHDEDGTCCSGSPALSHGERIFNIMACYFPITFSPPPGDPHGITAPMLIQALKHALCDDPHVSSFVIPFLMDQLLAPAESVCRSHAVFYLHFLVQRHANSKSGASQPALPPSLLLVLGQLSEALYDIALEDTTSLPLFSLSRPSPSLDSSDAGEDDTPDRTLTVQAIDLIALVCKQIGTSSQHAEALWLQFGEPMVSEIVKNTRKSVQNMTTKANMKVALAMASSTYKITSTVMDRLVPVLLGHVKPVLTHDMELRAASLGSGQPPQLLLQHDLERKQHDRNSAAVGLMYLAQMLSCTLAFDLNFSQYVKMAVGVDSGVEEPLAHQLHKGLLQFLCQYSLDFFRYGSSDEDPQGASVDRSSVGLYAGCLRCIQTLIALKLRDDSHSDVGAGIGDSDGSGADADDCEGRLLQQVTVNCCSVGGLALSGDNASSNSGYDWAADVRQASVLYVSQSRSMYLKVSNRRNVDSVFEERCIDVLRGEITAEPSALRLNNVFHTISHLLQPFSAGAGAGEKQSASLSWNVLDDKLLSILLTCITSATESDEQRASSGVQKYALSALIDCLPPCSSSAASSSSLAVAENHIVTSLVTPLESTGDDSNLQKLIRFAIGSSCDEGSLVLVCQIVHRVLAALATKRKASSRDMAAQLVIKSAVKTCIQAILRDCPPPAVIFNHASFDPTSSQTLPLPLPHGSSKNQASRVLLCLLNGLDKDCWVWKFINSIGVVEANDNEECVGLWAQLMNVLFSNAVLREPVQEAEAEAEEMFADSCTRMLAVVLNKSAAGGNLEVLLAALDNLIASCTASAVPLPLATQESVVQLLVLVVRALSMRRSVPISVTVTVTEEHLRDPHSKTWQDRFLHILLELLLQASKSTAAAQCETLAVVGKHLHLLSCEHKDYFLSAATSDCTGMMWRQKLWYKCLPVLTTAVQQASAQCVVDDDSVQQPISALLCLCSLASEMPLQVVHEHFPQLIAFSVQALMVNDPSGGGLTISGTGHARGEHARGELLLDHVRRSLRHAAVQCLLSSCRSTQPLILEALGPHLSTLVPLLLQGAQADPRSTLAATRAGCVQCLYFLAGGDMCKRFQYRSLHPVKRLVVRGLSEVLNDKKQSVRHWAAKVRNLWISLQD